MPSFPLETPGESWAFFEQERLPAEGGRNPGARLKRHLSALARNRSPVNCLEGSYARRYSTNAPACSAASCSSRSEPGRPPAPPLHRQAGLLPPAPRTHTSSSPSSCSPSRLRPPPTLALHADRHCQMHHLHTDSQTPFSCSRAKTESEPPSSSDGNDRFCGSV